MGENFPTGDNLNIIRERVRYQSDWLIHAMAHPSLHNRDLPRLRNRLGTMVRELDLTWYEHVNDRKCLPWE